MVALVVLNLFTPDIFWKVWTGWFSFLFYTVFSMRRKMSLNVMKIISQKNYNDYFNAKYKVLFSLLFKVKYNLNMFPVHHHLARLTHLLSQTNVFWDIFTFSEHHWPFDPPSFDLVMKDTTLLVLSVVQQRVKGIII